MLGWPYNEEDHMEIGNSGWIPVGEGSFLNKHNGHIIDEMGREYDEKGVLVYDPQDEDE
jgi:hypothetical protein